MQIAMLAADFTAGEADALRRAMAAWKRKGGLGPVPRAPGRPHGREGLRARVRRAHLQADRGLRRIRLPREPRRRLRAARLRQQLDQAPPPRRLPRRPAEQPADGLLRAGAAGARRARSTASRCGRSTCGAARPRARSCRPASSAPHRCGVSARRAAALSAARPRSRQRPVDRGRPAHRRRARRGAASPSAEDLARRARLERARARSAGAGRRAAEPHRPSPPGRLGGRRHRHAADRDAARDARRTRPPPCSPRRARPRTCWPTTARSASRSSAIRSRCCATQLRRRSRSSPRRCCAPTRTAASRAPAASSRTGSGPRRPRARSSSRSRTRPAPVNVIVWPRSPTRSASRCSGATLLTVYGQWQRQGDDEHPVMHLRGAEDGRPLGRCCRAWSTRSRDFR